MSAGCFFSLQYSGLRLRQDLLQKQYERRKCPDLNFFPAANTLASFFAPVTLTPGLPGSNALSNPNFALTTVMSCCGDHRFSRRLLEHIDHDDGIGLYKG